MDMTVDPIDLRLLDDWQRDLPLVPRPFAQMGDTLGCGEAEVLKRLDRMQAVGRISRVGATFAPNTISASTLAAVAAPPDRIESVAEIIGAQPGVNHSYLRENEWNLWFVATGPDRAHVDQVLHDIGRKTGLRVLDLRLVRPFNVDLGFRLTGTPGLPATRREVRPEVLVPGDRRLLQVLSHGLEMVSRPYLRVAEQLGRTEAEILDRLAVLQEAGILGRLGVIVRHRALGWRANAMVVWDINSDRIDQAGPVLAAHSGVTLCYERRPVADAWPYRLYCMIHARSRDEALGVLTGAAALPELAGVKHLALFSSRCFKQTGALISTKGTAAA
ncbi:MULTISPECIES: AsnC family transcriptional regulator [unclassified Meridianimarinicoccus]|uniref:siroheme decarboxylase subunit beta n=1 Tax=unclassified Meridianimarinicoccus TaxID=2923344 RepID=UPI001866E42D|nr:AsnC family transcriptional regulator [Fluviibacterium sp. MJW13]